MAAMQTPDRSDPLASDGTISDSGATTAYDLIVIGAGPAGEKGAAQAAYFGKRVAIVERAHVGGAVVNTGTLPSKTLRETALYLSGLRQRDLYGLRYTFNREVTVDDLFYRRRLVEHSHLDLVHQNIARHGIELIAGDARIAGPHSVVVATPDGSERLLRGEVLLVAAGSRPARPPEVPFDGARVFDTDSILSLPRIPRSLVIVGAGVIGSEYATLFGALGVEVTLIDGGERLLPFLDPELSAILCQQMQAMGARVLFERRVREIAIRSETDVRVFLDDGQELCAEAVLYSAGRQANGHGLGLEALGVAVDARGRIAVDEHYRTALPSIYAAGDVIGFPALASTSMEQGRVAVCHAFGFDYKRQVSSLIPYGLYTIPEVSMVGESESSLRAARRPYLVGRAHYRGNARGQIIGDEAGLLKLLFAPETQRLLGVHIIGERATELVHIGQMVMSCDGTLDAFIQSVFNFPTLADAYKYAAYDGLQSLERWRAEGAEARATT